MIERTTNNKVRDKRREKGLSQEELAKSVGVARITIGRIENGITDDCKFSTIQKIAKELDCTIDYLFCK